MLIKQPTVSESLPTLKIARSHGTDLVAINAIIKRAVMHWPMALRVRSRVVSILQYNSLDMASYTFFSAKYDEFIMGAIALDFEYNANDRSCKELLLHGIYVEPAAQGRGIGRTLLDFAEGQAHEHNYNSVILRAERVSRGFFEQCGYTHSSPKTVDDYPYVYRKHLKMFPPTHHTDTKICTP